MAQGKFKKERQAYHESCRDVARFVGLPEDSLINPDMKFDRRAILLPRLRLNPVVSRTEDRDNEDYEEVVYEETNYEQVISMPSSWQRALARPSFLFKSPLRVTCREAAHFSLIDKTYDEDPETAHEVLRKEKPWYYKALATWAIRPSKRKENAIARLLLNKEAAPEGVFRTAEKFYHYKTIASGLRQSFSGESNIERNVYFTFAGLSVALFTAGIIGVANNGMELITEASKVASERLSAGFMGSFAAMLMMPFLYYRGSRSLTPKNLSRFTEKERRHLLAFPREYIPLEQRYEELREYGFPL